MRLKGAVRLTFRPLTNDREGGVRGGAAKTFAQKCPSIQTAQRTSISRDNNWERGEEHCTCSLTCNKIWRFVSRTFLRIGWEHVAYVLPRASRNIFPLLSVL